MNILYIESFITMCKISAPLETRDLMLPKIEVKPSKGFLGAAKSTDKAPYREIDRKPEMYSYGEDSYFITPNSKEERLKCPKGIKR